MKKLVLITAGIVLCLVSLLQIIVCDRIIVSSAEGKTFPEVEAIPHNKTGLVLGTSKYMRNGRDNMFYVYRINAAKDLFGMEKIDALVISGDNGTKTYNEPEMMKDDLVANGVPADKIYLDYAGFRTLDSVIRMDKIFGQKEFTVISQKFQNERAIYLAEKNGLNAIGYNAEDVPVSVSPRVYIREKLARVKVFIDLLFNTQPKFLGEPVEIK
jgi:SanA protein